MTGEDSKTCTRCGEAKPLDGFYSDKSRASGKHPWCKACVLRGRAEWYTQNREKNLAYQAEWRAANQEKKAAHSRAWVENNRERKVANDRVYREKNRARLDEQIRAWHQANPESRQNSRRARRARKSGALVRRVYFRTILIRDCGICGICGEPIMESTIELDHVIPLAAGGWHAPDNVQLAHRTCNRRKAAKVAA